MAEVVFKVTTALSFPTVGEITIGLFCLSAFEVHNLKSFDFLVELVTCFKNLKIWIIYIKVPFFALRINYGVEMFFNSCKEVEAIVDQKTIWIHFSTMII